MIMKEEEKKYILSQFDKVDDIGEISDGYHTFNSLYNQRLCLFAALVNAYKNKAWKSRLHHDGEPCFGGGWFIVGITTPAGDYTYHYELKDWDLFDCKVLDKAPEWDGHTDKDVTRVLTLDETFDQINARVIQDNWDKLSEKKGNHRQGRRLAGQCKTQGLRRRPSQSRRQRNHSSHSKI